MIYISLNSTDVEAYHRLNQPTNPKKVINKLSKIKDVVRVMNNKRKLKSMKPQNIGVPFGCKTYINESLCKYYKHLWWKRKFLQTHGSIQSFWVTNGSIRIRYQNDEVTSVTHIETSNVTFWKMIFVTKTIMGILQIKRI